MGLQSVSQPIGQIINLRRNTNNVPGDAVAGTIQSVSQPIGDIIRFRQDTDVYASTWYIDGVLFTGTVVTAGPGRDYATAEAACAGTTGDLLILGYPGMYDTKAFPPVSGRNIYLRGIGDYHDIQIPNLNIGASSVSITGVENVSGWDDNYQYIQPYANGFVSKYYNPYGYSFLALAYVGSPPPTPPTLMIQYCSSTVAGWPFVWYAQNTGFYGNNQNFSIHRCRGTLASVPTSVAHGGTGSFVEKNEVLVDTYDYGPDYGSFRIVQGPLVTMPQSISQLIRQTGIRLRRNSSNVPGD